MAKQTTQYVDFDNAGKVVSFDLKEVWNVNGMNVQAMTAKLEAYSKAKAQVNAMLDAILAETEKAMDKAGNLEDGQCLAPWFNYGNKNVVRIVGQRHGQPRAKAQSNNAISNVATYMKPVAQSRLIQRNKH